MTRRTDSGEVERRLTTTAIRRRHGVLSGRLYLRCP